MAADQTDRLDEASGRFVSRILDRPEHRFDGFLVPDLETRDQRSNEADALDSLLELGDQAL